AESIIRNSQAYRCSDLMTSAARFDYITDFDWDSLRIHARSWAMRAFWRGMLRVTTASRHVAWSSLSWRLRASNRDESPAVVAFVQSVPGLAFLHRLVLASHMVCIEVGACGIHPVCLLRCGAYASLAAATSHRPWRTRRPSASPAHCRSGGRSGG